MSFPKSKLLGLFAVKGEIIGFAFKTRGINRFEKWQRIAIAAARMFAVSVKNLTTIFTIGLAFVKFSLGGGQRLDLKRGFSYFFI